MIASDGYEPLPGRVSGPMYSARMYRGPDHLLKTTVQGFHEHFRRFAWEDIQGIVVEETPWNGVVNVLLVLVLLLLVVSYLTFTDKDWRIALWYLPFLALISVLMLVNLRRGPTCKAWLITAVSRERLWSVNRTAVAESLAAEIAPIILERQAAAARAEAESAETEPWETAGSRAAVPRAGHGEQPVEIERGRWHAASLVLVALFMGMAIANLNLPRSHRILDFAEISAFVASCLVCLTAIIAQVRHRAPKALRQLGFILAGYHVAVVMLGLGSIAAMVAMMIENRGQVPDFEPRNTSWYVPTLYAEIGLQAAVLSFGAFTFLRLRRRPAGTAREP